jgi:hypothetical protein
MPESIYTFICYNQEKDTINKPLTFGRGTQYAWNLLEDSEKAIFEWNTQQEAALEQNPVAVKSSCPMAM